MPSADAAALASGRSCPLQYRWPGGWLVRVVRAPILANSDNSASDYSTGAWKRELSMTTIAGQSLPGATFGGNALELLHEASGVCISFSALEALRAWRLLEIPPLPHLSSRAERPLWDYTFTTAYAGSTRHVDAVGERTPSAPDGCSLVSRPATDLATGPAVLRKPLCKCRGSSGRATLINLCKPQDDADGRIAPAAADAGEPPEPPPPPEWTRVEGELVDVEGLLRGVVAPDFVEGVELWKDDLEPHCPVAVV